VRPDVTKPPGAVNRVASVEGGRSGEDGYAVGHRLDDGSCESENLVQSQRRQLTERAVEAYGAGAVANQDIGRPGRLVEVNRVLSVAVVTMSVRTVVGWYATTPVMSDALSCGSFDTRNLPRLHVRYGIRNGAYQFWILVRRLR
jgi:hypothetical protein